MAPTPSMSQIYAAVNITRYYQARQRASTSGEGFDGRLTEEPTEPIEPIVKCLYCTRKERLLTFRQLKRGDHICMGGENYKFNLGSKQHYFYTHHAIVKQVEYINDAQAMLTLIHFWSTAYDKKIKIQETTDMRDLHNDEIYVVKYKHKTRKVDNIIDRADTLVDKGLKYSLLGRNCEGFAHWCVVGLEESYQAESALQIIDNLIHNCNNTVIGAVLRRVIIILSTTTDDAAALAVGKAAGPIVFAIMVLVYGLYCKYKIRMLQRKFNRGEICSSCFSERRHDIWIRFGSFVIPQLVGFVAISAVSYGATAILVGCSALSLLLMWGLPKLRKKLQSPFVGKKHNIDWLRKIWIGDVVSFSYYGMDHVGIVSSVEVQKHTRGRIGKFKIIHYALPTMLRSREIREEEVIIDLNKTYLLLHDYSDYDMHAPEEVVARGRMRIGERKFGILKNRSSHFCHWAKVKETQPMPELPFEEQEVVYLRSLTSTDDMSNPVYANHMRGAKYATHTLPTNRAIIRDDITNGTLIQFKYRRFWHKAICTHTKSGNRPSVLIATVVHYGKDRIVTEETLTFDLRYDDIYTYNFHPLYRYKSDDVIRRAREKIGERKYSMFVRRSSHMAEEAIRKDKDKLVRNLNEVKKGDVISFLYWSRRHEAVVTGVIIDDSRSCETGSIRIVHYALPGLFSIREIMEENLSVDLSRDRIYIKMFAGYTTYPADRVVKRARSRVGERKFHCVDNTSFDFVHWAKVIQQPCVLKVTPVDGTDHVDTGEGDNVTRGKNLVLLPKVGETVEQFQVDWVKTWDELQPGIIVEYMYYMIWHVGIVSKVHPSRNMITVIHYGTDHLFAKRTIREDRLSVDLKQDRVWVYRCDPRKCHPPQVIVQKAKARLGENDWRRGNRSWDFCKACTLK